MLSLREVVDLCECECGFGMLTLLSGSLLVGVPCAGAVRDGIEQCGGPPPACRLCVGFLVLALRDAIYFRRSQGCRRGKLLSCVSVSVGSEG